MEASVSLAVDFMNRSTTLFFASLPVLALGLWLVIHLGSRLSANHDLSGAWQIDPVAVGNEPAGHRLRIIQSGLHAHISIDDGPPEDVSVLRETPTPQGGFHVSMYRTAWNLDLVVSPTLDALAGIVDGATHLQFMHIVWPGRYATAQQCRFRRSNRVRSYIAC